MVESARPMASFVELLVSFPTAPFTVALGVAVLYWLLVIVGAAGVDLLDGAGDGAAAGVKAAGEALGGGLKAAGEALGGAKGAADVLAAGKAGAEAAQAKAGLLDTLGLGGVPVTVAFTALTFFAWATSVGVVTWLRPDALLPQLGVFAGALLAGLVVGSAVTRPLRRVFSSPEGRRRNQLVGHLCTVTSTKVDAGFGTAEVSDGGAAIAVHVVCHKQNSLKKGDRALLIAYDAEKDVYDAEPLDFLEPHEVKALDDPDARSRVLAGRIKL